MIKELERVAAYRADEPPPDNAAVADATRALAQAIAQAGPSRRRGRSWTPRLALAGTACCAAVVIAVVLSTATGATPAQAALEQLAKVAARQAWTGTPGPGQYLYTQSLSLNDTDTIANGRECVVRLVQHREIWIATNGAGAIRESATNGRFTSPADRAICALEKITDPSSQDYHGTSHFGPGGLSFPTNNWHSLSTDPATLLVQLRRLDGGPRTAGEDFVHIGDFLRESDAPPAIRAELYRAAALIPGVRLLGVVRDHAGRLGLGIAFTHDGRPTSELILDQRTAALLGEATLSPAGAQTTWTVYLRSKIVDALPR